MDSTDILVVAGRRCRECVGRRLAAMCYSQVQVEVSTTLHPGDLAIIDGGSPQVFIGNCRGCQVAEDQDRDDFEILLDRIRARAHPKYGVLSWDGRHRKVTETVAFEENGAREPDEVVRARALRFLGGLSPEERAVAEVDVAFRDGTPVRAMLRAGTGELSAARLKELRTRAGLE